MTAPGSIWSTLDSIWSTLELKADGLAFQSVFHEDWLSSDALASQQI